MKDNDKMPFIKLILYILIGSFIIGIICGFCNNKFNQLGEKPVIYIYNSNNTSLNVDITIDKENLLYEYPYRRNGWWHIKTQDDSIVVYPSKEDRKKGINGKEYTYLFWEDNFNNFPYSFNEGFCIKGKDTREFLETYLNKLGMNQREINEFIIYWLPRMENNKYNIISFQTSNYEKYYPLKVEPKPNNILRVFMAYYPSTKYIDIKEQNVIQIRKNFKREGLYVVEWGGSELNGSEAQ